MPSELSKRYKKHRVEYKKAKNKGQQVDYVAMAAKTALKAAILGALTVGLTSGMGKGLKAILDKGSTDRPFLDKLRNRPLSTPFPGVEKKPDNE